MNIKFGDKVKIKKSIIGNNNNAENKEKFWVTIIVTILTGVIVGGIIYYLGWN